MGYVPALDGIRAIAVIAVMAFHARVPGFSGGFAGVDVFFVLSGFLITSLLMQERSATGEIALRRFYVRRLLRLTPPLLLMLFAYLALAPLLWSGTPLPEHARDAAVTVLYLSDYTYAWSIPKYLEHTWSLAVEEHFYLAWPLAVLYLARLQNYRHLMLALLMMYIAATAWRQGAFLLEGDWREVYGRFDARVSGPILGALLAFAARRPADLFNAVRPRDGFVALVVLAGSSICLGWRHPTSMLIGITIVELASAVLIVCLIVNRDTVLHRLLSTRPLVVTGVLSYGLYLWHYPVTLYFRDDSTPWYLVVALVLPISYACAALSYLTVERWSRKLRGRINATGRPDAEPRLAVPQSAD